MMIRDFSLIRFGGLENRSLSFSEGLNIVIGPNESGKSTIMAGMEHCLLTPVSLSKGKFRDVLGARWLPVSGGDTLRLEMSILLEGKSGKLVKQWGGSPQASLQLEGGGMFTSDTQIAEQIERLCAASLGTVKNILLTRQNTLSETVDELRKEQGVVQQLSDVLRRVVLETDGISVTRFLSALKKQYEQFFSKWDRERNCPEGDRGIENPWKQRVGTVLEAWYAYKRDAAALENTRQLEEKIQQIQLDLKSLREEADARSVFLEKNRQAYQDAGRRRAGELEIRNVAQELESVKEIQKKWNLAAVELESIEHSFSEMERTAAEKKKALDLAGLRLENKASLSQYRKLTALAERIKIQEQTLSSFQKLSREDYQRIGKLSGNLAAMKESLKAGKLHAKISSGKNRTFSIASGIGETESRDLLAGRTAEIDADGRIRICTDDFEVEVVSGQGNFKQTVAEYESQTEEYRQLCDMYSIEGYEDAQRMFNSRMKLENELQSLIRQFEDEGGKKALDDLGGKVRDFQVAGADPDLRELQNAFSSAQQKLTRSLDRKDFLHKQIKQYEDQFVTQDNLIDRLGSIKAEEKKKQDQLNRMSGLPAEYDRAEPFIADYNRKAEELKSLQEDMHRLQIEITGMEKDLPDISSEELEQIVFDRKETFEKILSSGRAIARILLSAERILDESARDPYGPFHEKVSGYLAVLTDGKYGSVHPPDVPAALPEGIVKADGNPLVFDMLSAGTKDIFSLALRLSLAEYLIPAGKAPLLLDDPFVDLDPGRQKLAAELVKQYAASHQCILFTCHPSQAELFEGAEVIQL